MVNTHLFISNKKKHIVSLLFPSPLCLFLNFLKVITEIGIVMSHFWNNSVYNVFYFFKC